MSHRLWIIERYKMVMNIIMQKQKIIILSLVLISSFISIYSLYYFWVHKVYFIGSDAYVYWSMADSFAKSGSFMDMTILPNEPSRTTQV